MKKYVVFIIFWSLLSIVPVTLTAQTIEMPVDTVYQAKVTDITRDVVETIPNQEERRIQDITAIITKGDRKGEIVTFTNDFFYLKKGSRFFLLESHHPYRMPSVTYMVSDHDRTIPLIFLFSLFIVVTIMFAGKQGVRALMALAGSIFILITIMIPNIINGNSPLIISLGVGILILFLAIVITHGWNRTSFIALLGTFITLLFTSGLALFAVHITHLSGFISEEVLYLSNNMGGFLNVRDLLLGGMLIGVLGVLDDIAITQVSVVQQLWDVHPDLSIKEVFQRSLRVGKDHMSSLVNTLVLAYIGVGLPLLLLFHSVDTPFIQIINSEVVTTEIIRMLVGSVGLILCVPITTGLAIWIYRHKHARTFTTSPHVCAHTDHHIHNHNH